MSNCSNHKKDLLGETDMRKAAEAIADLHYEALAELFFRLSTEIHMAAKRDERDGKILLAHQLKYSYHALIIAHEGFKKAWEISKPFMDTGDKVNN